MSSVSPSDLIEIITHGIVVFTEAQYSQGVPDARSGHPCTVS
jgi:hypothetical protein